VVACNCADAAHARHSRTVQPSIIPSPCAYHLHWRTNPNLQWKAHVQPLQQLTRCGCVWRGRSNTNEDFGYDFCNILAKGVGSPTAQLHSSVLASLHCLPPTWTLASGALHPLQPNDRARERRSTTHAIGRSRPSLLPAPTLGCALA
jgi:hypothetical protein